MIDTVLSYIGQPVSLLGAWLLVMPLYVVAIVALTTPASPLPGNRDEGHVCEPVYCQTCEARYYATTAAGQDPERLCGCDAGEYESCPRCQGTPYGRRALMSSVAPPPPRPPRCLRHHKDMAWCDDCKAADHYVVEQAAKARAAQVNPPKVAKGPTP